MNIHICVPILFARKLKIILVLCIMNYYNVLHGKKVEDFFFNTIHYLTAFAWAVYGVSAAKRVSLSGKLF